MDIFLGTPPPPADASFNSLDASAVRSVVLGVHRARAVLLAKRDEGMHAY